VGSSGFRNCHLQDCGVLLYPPGGQQQPGQGAPCIELVQSPDSPEKIFTLPAKHGFQPLSKGSQLGPARQVGFFPQPIAGRQRSRVIA
jgi:hypothetical protein